MAASILTTPTELLRLVFATLSRSDLYALCLTHRDLRAVAESFLYARVELTWTKSQTPPIAQFLHNIVRRPELASSVHVLVLSGHSFDDYFYEYKISSPKLPLGEVPLDGLVNCIENLSVSFASEWIQELRAGTVDAFMSLLLSQLRSLKSLQLSQNFTRESRLMGMMLRSALCEKNSHLSSFAYLQDVEAVFPGIGLFIRKYTDARNTADVLPLFYLPSVERIRVLIDNPPTFKWPGKTLPNPSKLISLDLTMLREGPLAQVLSTTPNLRKLKWDWYFRRDLQDEYVTDIIDLDQLAAGLSHVQNSLTDLTITAGTSNSDASLNFPEVRFKGSFKTFSELHMLQSLEVPIAFLLGFSQSTPNVARLEECLPRSLQWLTVTDRLCLQEEWEWEWECTYLLEAIRPWLQEWETFTPRLQGFRLLAKELGIWDLALLQGLEDIGHQSRIQVQIIEAEPVRHSGS
ncbi:F-box domain, cyclin-like [Penicillium roqueforti FM164]|uniref:F-box domain, cyclin-like n=1 Tax=Penicillium roqueforti (strain FM164) TaxID=1365484 RepID=W6Q455_PENRF|nr:F-box domain, cyclin-like [Penicillium roqueforti FM164]